MSELVCGKTAHKPVLSIIISVNYSWPLLLPFFFLMPHLLIGSFFIWFILPLLQTRSPASTPRFFPSACLNPLLHVSCLGWEHGCGTKFTSCGWLTRTLLMSRTGPAWRERMASWGGPSLCTGTPPDASQAPQPYPRDRVPMLCSTSISALICPKAQAWPSEEGQGGWCFLVKGQRLSQA